MNRKLRKEERKINANILSAKAKLAKGGQGMRERVETQRELGIGAGGGEV